MPPTATIQPSPGRLRRVLAELSPVLTALVTVLFAAGMATGGVIYTRRSPVREVEHAGTAAWWPHLGLFLLAVALLAVARLRAAAAPVELLLLAPLGRPAARRIGRTLRAAPRSPGGLARLVAAGLVAALLAYSVFRAGIQVTAGFDPNFTTNAWGGPSYLGAMACHYLDGALIAAASAWLTARLLVADRSADGAVTAAAGGGTADGAAYR
ncbi:hypothetical protein I6A60_01385 [Frankia sp. AgB1.9]|uniref:hypothetical protein n=1 Tax=unclassified Frankia TaxID=2632575 RepID=UPI001932EF9D|nr:MULTISPECIES: hypothetical protein [unclassified Frankia]MBL7488780.1 hypothetical protein [Frankia sp. AgW1.1]MBL7546539.1 hypothetical protein [Frankia sp. AgB1.9]MBL7625091.1 hypothetical protein [Frankia sp. AgB1.8]